MADSLSSRGDYVHALDTLLLISNEIENTPSFPDTLAVKTYFLMGRIHSIYGDSEAAIFFYNKALKRQSPLTPPELRMRLYSNLYQGYASRGDYDKAREAIDSLYHTRIVPAGKKLFHYNFSRGDLAFRQHRYNDAIRFYMKSLDYIDGNVVPEKMRPFPYSELAATYKAMGNRDSAFVYLKRFEESAESDSEPFVTASALRELMLWSVGDNRPDMAINYMNRYFALMDSLIDMRAFLKAKENIRRQEEESSSEKIMNMTEKVSHGEKVIARLFVILTIVIIVGALVLWYSSLVRRNNKILYAKNKELTEAEARYKRLLVSTVGEKNEESGSADGVADSSREKTADISKRDADSLSPEMSKDLLGRIVREMEISKPYLDPEFNLQALANMVNSNTKYVSLAINEHTGQNFRTFVNNYRIKEAERLLLDRENYGQYTMQWIAESVGIKSKSTFVAAFKKATGLTPSVFMKIGLEEQKMKKK